MVFQVKDSAFDMYEGLRLANLNRANSNNSVNQVAFDSLVDSENTAEGMRNAYRQLHGQFVELQLEMESMRTDRDSLLVEVLLFSPPL